MQKGVLGAGPKCKNPKGKLWSSQLDKDCGQSVCKLKDKKGVWEQCPRPATLEQLLDVEEKILNAVKKVEEKTEQCCCKPQIPTGAKLYYEKERAKYYGIPVAKGTTLKEGVVANTCEAVGMRAVCSGDSSCSYYSSRCQVVDFESQYCTYPMWGLAKKICGGNKRPNECPEMNGLFNYMKNWAGECGVVNGTWCARGDRTTPENPPVYYAYCVQGDGKDLAKMSDKQNNEKIKEAAANIPAATDLKIDEEAPSNFF